MNKSAAECAGEALECALGGPDHGFEGRDEWIVLQGFSLTESYTREV